jgi:hypothetical protein
MQVDFFKDRLLFILTFRKILNLDNIDDALL